MQTYALGNSQTCIICLLAHRQTTWLFVQVDNPTTGTWSSTGSMTQSRCNFELLPLKPNQCFGATCVGGSGGAIAIGVSKPELVHR
jgi:hypothetical protein